MLPKLKIVKKVAELLSYLEAEFFLITMTIYNFTPNQKTDNRQQKTLMRMPHFHHISQYKSQQNHCYFS